MSDKPVRSHTNISNRAKLRDTYERKAVYKSVLDNPFIVSWPRVPTNLQNAIISQTVAVLDGVAEYQMRRRAESRKRKSARDSGPRKRQRTTAPAENTASPSDAVIEAAQTDVDDIMANGDDLPLPLDAPDVLRHITLGINEVTKKLEALAKTLRQKRSQLAPPTISEAISESSSQVVLVCNADVNPPVLVDHLPNLVAACNSSRHKAENGLTWLVPLPAGAEHTLSVAVGLRRASVLMINSASPEFESLRPFLNSLTVLRAPWLLPVADFQNALIPTHIKQLKTTAPKDMKAAKERRMKGRADARVRRTEQAAAKAAEKAAAERRATEVQWHEGGCPRARGSSTLIIL